MATEIKPKNNVLWLNLSEFIVVHSLAVTAIFYFSWTNFFVMFLLFYLTLVWGVAIGFHRLLTHRSFVVPKWFEYVLTILGSMTLQQGAIGWVASHRLHHVFTETEQDPHSPKENFFWAHVGWLVFGRGQEHSPETYQKYTPDLLKDKFHVSFEKFNRVPAIIVAILLFLIGGWGLLAWGVGVRTVLSWHISWAVNSIGHSFGPQRFNTNEDSRNNWVLGILTFGDGWHNNHHAFPTSARHGFAWYELDLNFLQIKLLEKIGFAKKIIVPTQTAIERKLASDKSLTA
jgi:fatty-acid desaturase